MEVVLKKRILIDGDIIAYRASSSVQRDIDWGDGLWTCHAFLSDAVVQFRSLLDSILENPVLEGDKEVIFCFSDDKNFRKELCPTYKANRASRRKPTCYRALIDYIKKNYQSKQFENLEGDDVIGILATDNADNSVIVSMDKDMKTIPGKFFNFNTNEISVISEDEAVYWHMYQTLTGDITDGYTGCPTYGPVKAKRLLDSVEPKEYYKVVIDAYKKQGLSYEDFLLQARLSFILWAGYYEFDTKDVLLWEPY